MGKFLIAVVFASLLSETAPAADPSQSPEPNSGAVTPSQTATAPVGESQSAQTNTPPTGLEPPAQVPAQVPAPDAVPLQQVPQDTASQPQAAVPSNASSAPADSGRVEKSPEHDLAVTANTKPSPATPLKPPPPQQRSWFAWAGWALSSVLALLLLRQMAQPRSLFTPQDGRLPATNPLPQIAERLNKITRCTGSIESGLSQAADCQTKNTQNLAASISDMRSEFAILREELDRRTKEVSELRLGHEFLNRRSVLRAVAHALQIIEEDLHAGGDPRTTIQGVQTELQECLQNNNVEARSYAHGTRLADTKGISTQESVKEPAPKEGMKGTIGETIRSAYVFTGPNGCEEVLVYSRVTIYT